MRVAFVCDWFLPRLGGIELQLSDLATRLREHGHEVEVITAVPGPGDAGGTPVHRLRGPRLPRAGIVCTAAPFRELHRLLARGRYDVVHVHFGVVAPVAYGAAAIAASLGIPSVATFHSVLRGFRWPLSVARHAMGVDDWPIVWTAVSSVVARSIRPLVPNRTVALLPNATEPDWWRRVEPRTASTGVRAVSVMRLHGRKRPQALVRAIASARRQLPPGTDLRLTIIGDGGEYRSIRRLVARERLDGSIRFTGWLDRAGVRRELHAADVFVLPSRLEAFGIAALEARHAGLPVIAMADAGARDFLRPGEDALLASSDGELARHLTRFAADPCLRERLARGAMVPPPGMDWGSAVARHEAIYRRAGAPRGSTSSHDSPEDRIAALG